MIILRVSDHQSAVDASLTQYNLVPGMTGCINKVDFFVLEQCSCNKQNNTWLLGNTEFLFECSS